MNMRKRRKRLYTPQLHEKNVRKLYHSARRFGMPMTKLLNLIVAVALEDLDDNGPKEDSLDEGKSCGIFKGRIAANDYPHRVTHTDDDGRSVRSTASLCQFRKLKKVYVSRRTD